MWICTIHIILWVWPGVKILHGWENHVCTYLQVQESCGQMVVHSHRRKILASYTETQTAHNKLHQTYRGTKNTASSYSLSELIYQKILMPSSKGKVLQPSWRNATEIWTEDKSHCYLLSSSLAALNGNFTMCSLKICMVLISWSNCAEAISSDSMQRRDNKHTFRGLTHILHSVHYSHNSSWKLNAAQPGQQSKTCNKQQ